MSYSRFGLSWAKFSQKNFFESHYGFSALLLCYPPRPFAQYLNMLQHSTDRRQGVTTPLATGRKGKN